MISSLKMLLPLICALFSAGIAIAGKVLTTSVPSTCLTFLRIAIASVCFLPFINPKTFKRLNKSDLGILISAGAIGIFLSNILYFVGLSSSTALHAALINSLTPALMLMGTCLYVRRMPGTKQLASFVLALFGVFLIITEGDFSLHAIFAHPGNLLMLASVMCWVLYSMMIKKKSDALPSAAFTFGTLVIGALLLVPFSMQHDIGHTVRALTPGQWGLTLYIAIIGTGLGYFIYGKSVEIHGPDKTAFIMYSTAPVFVVILTYLFLDDPISSWEIAGTFCILASLFLHLRTTD